MMTAENRQQIAEVYGKDQATEEKNQPSWIQKYLDLADLLMRRVKRRDEPTELPKAS